MWPATKVLGRRMRLKLRKLGLEADARAIHQNIRLDGSV
jgi:hypothetical protein